MQISAHSKTQTSGSQKLLALLLLNDLLLSGFIT
jgi:hypothetical protein